MNPPPKPEAPLRVPENLPIKTSFRSLFEHFVTTEKKELEDRIVYSTAEQHILKRWEEFIIREGPTVDLACQPGAGANPNLSVNGRKELEDQIATAKAARSILQNLERVLTCRCNLNDVGTDAVSDLGTADMQSEDPRKWSVVGRQLLRKILPISTTDFVSNPSLPTTFLMAIHGPEGKTIMQRQSVFA